MKLWRLKHMADFYFYLAFQDIYSQHFKGEFHSDSWVHSYFDDPEDDKKWMKVLGELTYSISLMMLYWYFLIVYSLYVLEIVQTILTTVDALWVTLLVRLPHRQHSFVANGLQLDLVTWFPSRNRKYTKSLFLFLTYLASPGEQVPLIHPWWMPSLVA